MRKFKVGDRVRSINFPDCAGTITDIISEIYIEIKWDHTFGVWSHLVDRICLIEEESPTTESAAKADIICPNNSCRKPNDFGAKKCWFCEGTL